MSQIKLPQGTLIKAMVDRQVEQPFQAAVPGCGLAAAKPAPPSSANDACADEAGGSSSRQHAQPIARGNEGRIVLIRPHRFLIPRAGRQMENYTGLPVGVN